MAAKVEQFELSSSVKQALKARKGIMMQAKRHMTELQKLKQMAGMTDQFLMNAAKEMPNDTAQQEA